MTKEKEIKFPCDYPGCKCEAQFVWRLKVGNETFAETNEFAFAELPFCPYHFHIVCGGDFYCESEEIEIDAESKTTETKFYLRGPFKEIELIEQVMAAREITRIVTKEEEQKVDKI
jgi:hypothetical protein